MARHAAALAAAAGLPLVIQAFTPVSIPSAALLFAQGLCLIWATRHELDRRAISDIGRKRLSA